MEKEKEKKSSFFTSLLVGIAGVAIGFGAKFVADEFIFKEENEKEKEKNKQNEKISENKPSSIEEREINKYYYINENNKSNNKTDLGFDEYESFLCPISQEIMTDPVITPKGITFDKKSILNWLEKSQFCPITKTPLHPKDLVNNYGLKSAISEYMKKQQSKNY